MIRPKPVPVDIETLSKSLRAGSRAAESLLRAPAGGSLTPLYSQPGPRFCCVYQGYTKKKGALPAERAASTPEKARPEPKNEKSAAKPRKMLTRGLG